MSKCLYELYDKSVGNPCYKDFNSVVEEIYEKARERILDGCNLPYTINVSHYNQDLALLNPALAFKYGIIGNFTKVGTDIVYTIDKFVKVPEVSEVPEPILGANTRHKCWWEFK